MAYLPAKNNDPEVKETQPGCFFIGCSLPKCSRSSELVKGRYGSDFVSDLFHWYSIFGSGYSVLFLHSNLEFCVPFSILCYIVSRDFRFHFQFLRTGGGCSYGMCSTMTEMLKISRPMSLKRLPSIMRMVSKSCPFQMKMRCDELSRRNAAVNRMYFGERKTYILVRNCGIRCEIVWLTPLLMSQQLRMRGFRMGKVCIRTEI